MFFCFCRTRPDCVRSSGRPPITRLPERSTQAGHRHRQHTAEATAETDGVLPDSQERSVCPDAERKAWICWGKTWKRGRTWVTFHNFISQKIKLELKIDAFFHKNTFLKMFFREQNHKNEGKYQINHSDNKKMYKPDFVTPFLSISSTVRRCFTSINCWVHWAEATAAN